MQKMIYVTEQMHSFSKRRLEISETDLTSWVEGTEGTTKMMTDEGICDKVQEEGKLK